MAVNKVVYGTTVLVDLTADTVTPSTLMQGYTAHDKSGALITGTATGGDEFIIVLRPGQDDYYYPDCTYAEAKAALNQNKTLVFFAGDNVSCSYDYDWNNDSITYYVDQMADFGGPREGIFREEHLWTSSGVTPIGYDMYMIPTGTKSISANGTGIDVTEYASVDVAVPVGGNDFIVTLSYNESTEMWEPDCTYAEAAAAYQAGKEFVAAGPTIDDMVAADCVWNADQSVLYYMVYFLSSSIQWDCRVYSLSSNGIEQVWDEFIRSPTGTINITASGNTDVRQYATASVAAGSATITTSVTTTPDISVDSDGLVTASLNGSVNRMPIVTSGYITSGTLGTIYYSGSKTLQLETQTAKTVTPSTSAQTAVAAGKYTTGAVTVAAMPSGTAGTPTATKGTVSNHSVSVTPSVTNTTGYITGGTKTGTAVTVSASELVSGSETKTANGTYDVTNLASLVVNIPFVTYHTSTSEPTSSQGSNGDIWLVTE